MKCHCVCMCRSTLSCASLYTLCVSHKALECVLIFRTCFDDACVHHLSSSVLVLAHSDGVCLLRPHPVQDMVSVGGCPGIHLERRDYPLIRMSLDPG